MINKISTLQSTQSCHPAAQSCHPERSEGSFSGEEILRCAQDDIKMTAFFSTIILFIALIMQTLAFADVQETYPFKSPADSARFQQLTQTIRCVVCQNQNIADSSAPLANDFREKVYRMVLAQRSDTDIQDYLVKRYGEYILLKPRISMLTILLWLFPLLGLTSILMLFLHLRRDSR